MHPNMAKPTSSIRICRSPNAKAMSLIVIMDKQMLKQSRLQLVDWGRRCQTRGGLGFVTGISARVVAQMSRGLKDVLYNAGSNDVILASDLLGWFDWEQLVFIENGVCWEIPLDRKNPMIRRMQVPMTTCIEQAYAQAGTCYQDK